MALILSLIVIFDFKIRDMPNQIAKILFFHVSTAWVGTLAFFTMGYYAIRFIFIYKKDADKAYLFDIKSYSNCVLGLIFMLIATITGAIWSYYSWGIAWNWDPRQISILILIIFYLTYFALRNTIKEIQLKQRLSSVYAIIGIFINPLLVFILPRIYKGLHPEVIKNGSIAMDDKMLVIFVGALLAFTGLYYWLYQLTYRKLLLNQVK